MPTVENTKNADKSSMLARALVGAHEGVLTGARPRGRRWGGVTVVTGGLRCVRHVWRAHFTFTASFLFSMWLSWSQAPCLGEAGTTASHAHNLRVEGREERSPSAPVLETAGKLSDWSGLGHMTKPRPITEQNQVRG